MSESIHDPRRAAGSSPLDLEQVRTRLSEDGLRETEMDRDPFEEFARWYNLVLASPIRLPDAMTLATATPDGRPSARMVLLKGYDRRGFVFFTNFESRKAVELELNPVAALVFYWKELDRQVRIEGTVARISGVESDAYFATRPWGSRISAAVSRQSSVVGDRTELERRFEELSRAHPEGQIPRPENWGGYRLDPVLFEFWQGRLNRLHDRIRYIRSQKGSWRIERLEP
jgi:pyridoxamine 5'-phosphate oxidase